MIWIYLKGLLFFIFLAFGAYEDLKTREIPNSIPALILLTGFIKYSPFISIMGLLLTSLPFLLAALIGGGMGGGDIKLMAACGFMLGPLGGTLQTITGLSLVLLYILIWTIIKGKKIERKTKIPLAPFLGAGGILAYMIIFIGG